MTMTPPATGADRADDLRAWAAEAGAALAASACRHDVEGSWVGDSLRPPPRAWLPRPRRARGARRARGDDRRGLDRHARARPPLRVDGAGDVDAPARDGVHRVALSTRSPRRRGDVAARASTTGSCSCPPAAATSPGPGARRSRWTAATGCSGVKAFASQSPAGSVMSTMFVYDDPERGPAGAEHGRAVRRPASPSTTTGTRSACAAPASNDVTIDDVFVPDERVLADRPYGVLDPPLQVIASIAFSIIDGVYLGIAEAALQHAVAACCGAVRRPGRAAPDRADVAQGAGRGVGLRGGARRGR